MADLKYFIEAIQKLGAIGELNELLNQSLYYARALVQADAGSIYLLEGDRLVAYQSHNDILPEKISVFKSMISVPVGDSSMAGYVAKTGHFLMVPNIDEIPSDAPYRFNRSFDLRTGFVTHSALTFPLFYNNDELVGVLQLLNYKNEAYQTTALLTQSTDAIKLLSFFIAHSISRSKDNNRLFLRLVGMVQLHDPLETGAHIMRVGKYAVALYAQYAVRYNLDHQYMRRMKDILHTAAMLHDIGKIAVPDSILKKPGKLTKEEFTIIQRHTTEGARVFSEQRTNFDSMAYDIILQHHENYDGSGYPFGRMAQHISLFAQIVSIVDVFDALTSERSYKQAWPIDDATEEIKRLAGTKFSLDLVECFIQSMPDILFIRSEHTDTQYKP
jgi:HD-GYP domain-containing protein (c-di-GMP phosphodiesterase class II)